MAGGSTRLVLLLFRLFYFDPVITISLHRENVARCHHKNSLHEIPNIFVYFGFKYRYLNQLR